MHANAATLADLATAQYQSPVRILEVNAGTPSTVLNIWGQLPNPCYGSPAALLVEDFTTPDALVLHLAAASSADACIETTKDFTTSIDLATLVKVAHLNLDQNKMYLVKVSGSNFQISLPGKDLL
jgi:hypothetical protein